MWQRTAALIIPLFLASCAPATSFNEKGASSIAPNVVQYSEQFQAEAAAEVDSGKCERLSTMAEDYCVVRDQARAIAGLPMTCTAPFPPATQGLLQKIISAHKK